MFGCPRAGAGRRQKVQEDITDAYEEEERALELLRQEGENESEELLTE